MKKIIACIWIFFFTVQIISPAYAQLDVHEVDTELQLMNYHCDQALLALNQQHEKQIGEKVEITRELKVDFWKASLAAAIIATTTYGLISFNELQSLHLSKKVASAARAAYLARYENAYLTLHGRTLPIDQWGALVAESESELVKVTRELETQAKIDPVQIRRSDRHLKWLSRKFEFFNLSSTLLLAGALVVVDVALIYDSIEKETINQNDIEATEESFYNANEDEANEILASSHPTAHILRMSIMNECMAVTKYFLNQTAQPQIVTQFKD